MKRRGGSIRKSMRISSSRLKWCGAVVFRRMDLVWNTYRAGTSSHVLDHLIGKLAALDLFRPFHLPGEIVGDGLGGNGAFQSLDDELGHCVPAHVFEHHDAGEDDAAGVDLVLVGVLGGGAVGGFEDG